MGWPPPKAPGQRLVSAALEQGTAFCICDGSGADNPPRTWRSLGKLMNSLNMSMKIITSLPMDSLDVL
jgi:hypothetical protein